MPALRNSLNIRSRVMWVRAFFNTYKRRVIAAGGVIQNEPCAVRSFNNNLLRSASWTLVPSGIEEDIVFAQKPTSGLGDLTFTRASDATYTDSTGVVRRSPYNLFTNSEDFDTWTKQQVNVSTNVAANPLTSVVNADLLIPDTTNNNHRIFKIATVPSSSVQSVYLKAAGYNYVSLGKAGGIGGSTIIFNLSNGTVSGSASGFSGTISPAGNGWYLCSLISSGATNDYASFSNWIVIRDNSTNLVFTGDGTSGVLVANAQLVEGTEALDYFPTTNRQDVPRIDFRNADGTLSSCGRLLLEPQRTNSIRNSSMVGAVAGSPGTLPTNWTQGSALGGFTRTVVGIGTENGLPYIDIRYNGTANNTFGDVLFESSSVIASANAATWTESAYLRLIAAPNPPLSARFAFRQFNSGGTFLSVTQSTAITVTTSLARYDRSFTTNQATVAFVQPSLFFDFTNGATYDFTIRIAAPQMELGAYATTWVPTTTAAVTRLADTASKTGVSSLIGQTEGTMFFEGTALAVTEIINAGRSTINSIFFSTDGSGFIRTMLYADSTSVIFASSILGTSRFKAAFAYKSNSFAFYVNGNLIQQNTTATFTPNVNLDRIDVAVGGYISNKNTVNCSQAALFPTRLTNAQLAQLTTL